MTEILLNQACNCIKQDDIDGANVLLNKLKAKKKPLQEITI